jgi:hypothetical protein
MGYCARTRMQVQGRVRMGSAVFLCGAEGGGDTHPVRRCGGGGALPSFVQVRRVAVVSSFLSGKGNNSKQSQQHFLSRNFTGFLPWCGLNHEEIGFVFCQIAIG